MAEARFISGQLRLAVSYLDRSSEYKVKICPVPMRGAPRERCETVRVGTPASGSRSAHGKRLSVDDPRAFKQAAHAAISFAGDDIQEYADPNRRGSGWLVRPLRRKKRSRR